jgi:hypothetical protein
MPKSSLNSHLDAWLVRDDAINVDARHFLGGRRTQDDRRKKNHTWHSET